MLESDVALSVHNGADDEELNSLIMEYTGISSPEELDVWRKNNYLKLRGWAYPDQKILFDAIVKQQSSDSEIQDEGALQLQTYVSICFSIKSRFPKP